KRVDKIAEAAAMMTDTTMERVFIDGTADTVPHFTLEKIMYKNFLEVGVPEYTAEEWDFAKKLKKSYDYIPDKLAGGASAAHPEIAAFVKQASDNGTKAINDFIIPQCDSDHQSMGSTDVADVSWLTPTAQIRAVTYPANAPGHSWQNVSCGITTLGHKGLLAAGKVIAGSAIDLFLDPGVIEEAKKEFEEKTKIGYLCPIPEGVPPTIPGE
ncbi:MAG: amidohydrolase, partial [Oscillospiraceae bacterium]|nr:amidohydrolase [Oscillospiraceae bacterium]